MSPHEVLFSHDYLAYEIAELFGVLLTCMRVICHEMCALVTPGALVLAQLLQQCHRVGYDAGPFPDLPLNVPVLRRLTESAEVEADLTTSSYSK